MPGPYVWIQASSADVLRPLRQLIGRMTDLRPEIEFVITLSAGLDQQNRNLTRLRSDGIAVVATPADTPAAAQAFLNHWRPATCLWIGSELRAPLLLETAKRGCHLIGLDTARPQTPPRWWKWLPGLRKSVLAAFDTIIVADETSAQNRRRLGAPAARIEQIGLLEEGSAPLPCNEKHRAALSEALKTRPVWAATHVAPDEVNQVLAAQKSAARRAHRLLLALHLEDPETLTKTAEAAQEMGLSVQQRCESGMPDDNTDILLTADPADLGLWYRLAPAAFLGQSLTQGGGADPFEAAALGAAILHGPNLSNYRDAYAQLTTAGAAQLIRNTPDLSRELLRLQAPEVAATMAHAAWEVSSSGAAVTDRLLDLAFAAIDESETP